MLEYVSEDAAGTWPLCANILDPVRASVVCNGPAQILQVFEWFTGWSQSQRAICVKADIMDEKGRAAAALRLPVCRVKNKFAFYKEELVGGYQSIYSYVLPNGYYLFDFPFICLASHYCEIFGCPE